MKNKIFGFFIACLLLTLPLSAGCEPAPMIAQRVLEDEGFVNIQLTGYEFASCSDSDGTNTGFTATRIMPDGTRRNVSGVVCCGLFLKACTVRH